MNNVPFVVYESEMMRKEKTIKRLSVVIIVLALSLAFTVYMCMR